MRGEDGARVGASTGSNARSTRRAGTHWADRRSRTRPEQQAGERRGSPAYRGTERQGARPGSRVEPPLPQSSSHSCVRLRRSPRSKIRPFTPARRAVRVVELGLVDEHVRVGVGGDGRLRCPTNSPIRAHGTPRRWSSEIRRWRRSCGDQSGIAAARQPFAIEVRSASAPLEANRRASRVAELRCGRVRSISSASGGWSSTHNGLRVLVVAARRRTRRRGSS